jgi:malate dehydrogenase (oxaloacetate-decarboxylating)(NADP+)
MVTATAMLEHDGSQGRGDCGARPVIFALSNPKTQAEVIAENAYKWSDGKVIYGSGTQFDPVTLNGKTFAPGQVNNVYIFPGLSFGCICCHAKAIPDSFFMVSAEAVANSLDETDIAQDRVIPSRDRLREVALNVAAAVAFHAQEVGLANKKLGSTLPEVRTSIEALMWTPGEPVQIPA